MERYQSIQNRAAQTAAVVREQVPTLDIGGVTTSELLAQALALGVLAQARDDALAAFDSANNAENQGTLAIAALTVSLPRMAQGELDVCRDAESALLDLLDPVYAIEPRSNDLAVKRGKKLAAALLRINAYLGAQTPPRKPIASAGQGLAELSAALDAQTVLTQRLEERAADVSTARSALDVAANALDRLNKRFYSKLKSEARSDPSLAKALAQIETASANLPPTLSIHTIRQGGAQNRQVLVGYVHGTFDNEATNSLEWKLGADTTFAHSAAADPSGNAIGPFDAGTRVQLHTRVRNGNGTTLGSVRTLTIV